MASDPKVGGVLERNVLVIVAGLLCGGVVTEFVRQFGQMAFIAEILLRDRIAVVVTFVSAVSLIAGAVMMSAFTAALVKTSRPRDTAAVIAAVLAGVLVVARNVAPNWLPGVSVTMNVVVPAALAGALFLAFRRAFKPEG